MFGRILALVLMLCASGANAAEIVVDLASDSISDNGRCSLAEAIQSANDDLAPHSSAGECTNGQGADTIRFSTGGTILLSAHLPTISSALTIEGPIVISGQQTHRVFQIDANNQTVHLQNLELIEGQSGASAGDRHGGVIKIDAANVVILEQIKVIDGDANGQGGGIWSDAPMVATDLTISGNDAGTFGGGLYLSETQSIECNRCAIVNNSALNGGGIVLRESTNSLFTNTTISHNQAESDSAGVLVYSNASATFVHSTIAFNTAIGINGGFSADLQATVDLTNTLIANNQAAQHPDCFATITSQGGNLIGIADGCIQDLDASDLNGSQSTPLNAPLLPLMSFPGFVSGHPLHPDSPAVDGARTSSVFCIPEDLRGVARPTDGNLDQLARCDIGAYELIWSDGDDDQADHLIDNCPALANTDQANADEDQMGDLCDDDDDNDGLPDQSDNCPVHANEPQDDLDANGLGDPCDDDIDGDGLSNDVEDLDGDGDPLDDDTDGDGTPDYIDTDDDDDGVPTRQEVLDSIAFGEDIDQDGKINAHDRDSNGDGILDQAQLEDTNDNGVPDYLDPLAKSSSGCRLQPGESSQLLWLVFLLVVVLAQKRLHQSDNLS